MYDLVGVVRLHLSVVAGMVISSDGAVAVEVNDVEAVKCGVSA